MARDVGTKLQLRPESPQRKKRPRLQRPDYVGRRAYHVVLTTTGRAPVFEDSAEGQRCVEYLSEAADFHRFRLLAYCVMPEHVHAVVFGADATSNLLAFVQRFKQRTSYQFKRESGDRLWQQSFFDRVLRSNEHPRAIADYVFANPVEAGLTTQPFEYPLSGGEYFRGVARDGAEASSLHSVIQERTHDQPA